MGFVSGLSKQKIEDVVEDYLQNNPVGGLTPEQEEQIEQNTADLTVVNEILNQNNIRLNKNYFAGVKIINENKYISGAGIITTNRFNYFVATYTDLVTLEPNQNYKLSGIPIVTGTGRNNTYVRVLLYDSNNIFVKEITNYKNTLYDGAITFATDEDNYKIRLSIPFTVGSNIDATIIVIEKFTPEIRFSVNVDCGYTNKGEYTAVDINDYTSKKIYSDNAVLYLPLTYDRNGEKTKLIIFCKAAGTRITEESDPVTTNFARTFDYLRYLGYAVLAVDGMPDGLSEELQLDDTRVVGNYVAVQSVIKAYNYIINNYNIDTDNVYIFGYSQGGMYAENVIDLSGINFKAAALLSPMVSMRFQQWDLTANVSVGGVSYTKPARLNIARLFGFDAVRNDEELNLLSFEDAKVVGYDPFTRDVENVYTGFEQKNNLWKIPEGTIIEDINMKKHIKCPHKIWLADNDTVISSDVTKVFAQSVRNCGEICDIKVFSSGGHSVQSAQTDIIDTYINDGVTSNLYPLAYDIALWFCKFGGYEPNV